MIGLKRGTVKLVKNAHKKWSLLFEKEKILLSKTFGKQIIAIEHVGSTAIPKLLSKPIIDINIGVKSIKIAKSMKKKFEGIGYEYRPFIPGKTITDLKRQVLYVKGPEKKRTHYVHITVFDNPYWKDGLLFRNYLQNNKIVRQEYATLKTKLAEKFTNDRVRYTMGKKKFIKKVLMLARKIS